MNLRINQLKPLFLLIFLLPLVFSCEEDDLQISDQAQLENLPIGDFFRPMIQVDKGNYSVQVEIIDPRPFTNYTKVPADPDYYEIFYSDNPDNLKSLGKYDYPESEVLLDDLANGTPLYFTVSTNQDGFRPLFSDTVMVVPSKIQSFEELFPNYDFPFRRFTVSQSLDYLTFESYDFINEDYGTTVFYYVNTSNDSLAILGPDNYQPSWANQSNTFAYTAAIREDNTLKTVGINLFNPETNETQVLINTEGEAWSVGGPVFSPDDKFMAYSSSESSTESYYSNIWVMDLETLERRQITNFKALNFTYQGWLDWSPDGQSIYLTGYQQPTNVYGSIYKVDINSGELSSVIKTGWQDIGAAISPDNSKLAFWSKRSGDWDLWIYNLNSGDLSQVTGGSKSYFFNQSNIIWLSGNELVLQAFGSGSNRVLKTWL